MDTPTPPDWDAIRSGDAQKLANFAAKLIASCPTPDLPKRVLDTRLLFLLSVVAAGASRAMDLDADDYDVLCQAAWKRSGNTNCRHR